MNTSETSIWNSTQGKLKNFVFKHIKDKATTDDIVQDVFLKVHEKVGQLKESDKLVGWIFQITRNAITDHFRKQARTINSYDVDWESEKVSLNDCVHSCLHDMLATLPEKYRQALEMTELQNVPQIELAQRLGISYSGAKSRVQRARQILKAKMDELYDIKMDSYGNVVVCENKTACSCSEKDMLSTEIL